MRTCPHCGVRLPCEPLEVYEATSRRHDDLVRNMLWSAHFGELPNSALQLMETSARDVAAAKQAYRDWLALEKEATV